MFQDAGKTTKESKVMTTILLSADDVKKIFGLSNINVCFSGKPLKDVAEHGTCKEADHVVWTVDKAEVKIKNDSISCEFKAIPVE